MLFSLFYVCAVQERNHEVANRHKPIHLARMFLTRIDISICNINVKEVNHWVLNSIKNLGIRG